MNRTTKPSAGSEGEAPGERGSLARYVYGAAILVLLSLACYSTFEGFRAIWGGVFIAVVLTGVFQLALTGSALFLGKDLAKYVNGVASARSSVGRRLVRYGVPSLIYVACWALCAFFAFTFYHRYLVDRGTGVDLVLPKINVMSADYIQGDLSGAAKAAFDKQSAGARANVAVWADRVEGIHKKASEADVVAALAKSISNAASERDRSIKSADAAIIAANKAVEMQRREIEVLTSQAEQNERLRGEAEDRIKALEDARTKEAPPSPSSPPRPDRLPANGDAFRLTRAPECQPERSSGVGPCSEKIDRALKDTRKKIKDYTDAISSGKAALDKAKDALSAAEQGRKEAEDARTRIKRQASGAQRSAAANGDAWLTEANDRLEAFKGLPTLDAFRAASKDCTTSADALTSAGKGADGVSCRPAEVERFAEDFTKQARAYDLYVNACGGRQPVERTEAIERQTRAALVGDTTQDQQKVDDALRRALNEVVGDCIVKAREIGSDVLRAVREVETTSRTLVAGNLLNRGAQDRAFDAITSLFAGHGDLPVVGALFLAVLQETLILCFSILLHRSDYDDRAQDAPEGMSRRAFGDRSDLDWTPDPDRDPPRILGAKFLYSALEIASDGSGHLTQDYAAAETDKVALNADAVLKELARLGHVVDRRGGRQIRPEGVAHLEAIVVAHHDEIRQSRPTPRAAAPEQPHAAQPGSAGHERPLEQKSPPGQAAAMDDAVPNGRADPPPQPGDPRNTAASAAAPGSHPGPTAPPPRRKPPRRDAGYAFRSGSE